MANKTKKRLYSKKVLQIYIFDRGSLMEKVAYMTTKTGEVILQEKPRKKGKE